MRSCFCRTQHLRSENCFRSDLTKITYAGEDPCFFYACRRQIRTNMKSTEFLSSKESEQESEVKAGFRVGVPRCLRQHGKSTKQNLAGSISYNLPNFLEIWFSGFMVFLEIRFAGFPNFSFPMSDFLGRSDFHHIGYSRLKENELPPWLLACQHCRRT